MKKYKVNWWLVWFVYVLISSILELVTDNFGRGNPSYFWCLLFIITNTVYLGNYVSKKFICIKKQKNNDNRISEKVGLHGKQ